MGLYTETSTADIKITLLNSIISLRHMLNKKHICLFCIAKIEYTFKLNALPSKNKVLLKIYSS